MATAYVKDAGSGPARVQPLEGGVVSSGEPLRGGKMASNWRRSWRTAGCWQHISTRAWAGRLPGGRLLVADMRNRQAIITDVAAI